MPSPLFDYIEGSFHTMGYRPGSGALTIPGPGAPTSPGASMPLCNPASVGKRFSFTFPSGKKWTFSNKVDAEARAFYCNPASIAEPEEEPTEPPLGEQFVGCLPWDQAVEIRRRITREQKGDGCYADINFSLPECVRAREEDKRFHEMRRDAMIRAGQCPSSLSLMNQTACQATEAPSFLGFVRSNAQMKAQGNCRGEPYVHDPRELFVAFKNCPMFPKIIQTYQTAYGEEMAKCSQTGNNFNQYPFGCPPNTVLMNGRCVSNLPFAI